MNSIRCSNCSLLNFAEAEVCKRCNSPLGVEGGTGWDQPQHDYAAHAGSEFNRQPYASYQSYYAPSVTASKSRGKGGLLVVVAILALVGVVGVPYVLKNRKGAVPNVTWRDYTAPDGTFSVSLPSAPEEVSLSQPTAAGNVQIHMLGAKVNKDGGCIVMYADFPAAARNLSFDNVVDTAMQGLMRRQMLTVVDRKNITLSGYQGAELELKSPPGGVSASGACRVYWAPPRMYLLIAAGADTTDLSEIRSQFFNSFKLLK